MGIFVKQLIKAKTNIGLTGGKSSKSVFAFINNYNTIRDDSSYSTDDTEWDVVYRNVKLKYSKLSIAYSRITKIALIQDDKHNYFVAEDLGNFLNDEVPHFQLIASGSYLHLDTVYVSDEDKMIYRYNLIKDYLKYIGLFIAINTFIYIVVNIINIIAGNF